MNSIEASDKKYGPRGPAVRLSVAMVAVAGRSKDPAKVQAERLRHYLFMANLP
jgi:hypothetical protein